MKWLKNAKRTAAKQAAAVAKAQAPRLVVSTGCPSGIGPEIAVASAVSTGVRALLVGDFANLQAAAKLRGVDPRRLVRVDDPNDAFAAQDDRLYVFESRAPLKSVDRAPGKPTRVSGAAQLAWIDVATDFVTSGIADALVTGPVSKDVIARSGAPGARVFRGHTEHLAGRLGAKEVTMAFWTHRLTASLVTTHLRLADVPKAITAAAVARAAYWTARFVADLGAKGRVAVAALNPHAGEGGLLGDEERRTIEPGIRQARARLAKAGIAVELDGPVPAESAFRLAASGRYVAVVGMYHDQATIPMKLLGFGEAVNVSLGLPIIRTSVDHGTAYDLAGKGTADESAMAAALSLAQVLVTAKAT